jgi:replicative DNA helicase
VKPRRYDIPTTGFDKAPPHQLEAEQSLLGSIMLDENALAQVLDLLTADDFYKISHGQVFQAFQDLFEQNLPIDLVTVTDQLQKKEQLKAVGGASYLASLLEVVPSASNASAYAKIINEKALLRRLIKTSTEITARCYSGFHTLQDILASAEASIASVTDRGLQGSPVRLSEAMQSGIESLKSYNPSQSASGICSHFVELDKLTAGFQPSDLIILAARPSMGKTALALNVARNVAVEDNTPVLIFSMEMSKEQLVMRLLCSEARVDSQQLRSGYLTKSDAGRMLSAATAFASVPIYIDDSPGLTALQIRAKSRRILAGQSQGLVLVDYLQMMQSPDAERREKEVSDISRSLKNLAKELNVPVIALSQLNRKLEDRHDKRPMLSDLRESGSLEQDADLIVFIYRDEVYSKQSPERGTAEILIGKQRNGPTGMARLIFNGSCTRFDNLN